VGDEISAADEDQPHDAPAASEVIALDRESPEHDEEGWDAGDESEEEGLEGEGEGDEDGDGKPGKLSHRAIPTWEQAIGLMVATNMESRAKNPGAGKPRGRGRRGPRDRPRRN
jgi:hypothetical protein